jgi:hypothetical protein
VILTYNYDIILSHQIIYISKIVYFQAKMKQNSRFCFLFAESPKRNRLVVAMTIRHRLSDYAVNGKPMNVLHGGKTEVLPGGGESFLRCVNPSCGGKHQHHRRRWRRQQSSQGRHT